MEETTKVEEVEEVRTEEEAYKKHMEEVDIKEKDSKKEDSQKEQVTKVVTISDWEVECEDGYTEVNERQE